MENKEKEIDLEERIKILSELIDAEKKLSDSYNDAIQKLSSNLRPDMLEDLGFIYENKVRNLARLQAIKARLENRGLGDPYADEAFGILRY